MKSAVILSIVVTFISFAIFLQIARMDNDARDRSPSTSETVKSEKKPKSRFPEDLAPALQGEPVDAAAAYKAGDSPHRIAFLTPAGSLHDWNERPPMDWQSDCVEDTELIVIVPTKQREIFVNRITYPNNAPPIERFTYELSITVIEPKTGRQLDQRLFRNTPRQIHQLEAYETTLIGRVIEWGQVYNWVAKSSKVGFPQEDGRAPVVKVVE